MKASKGGMSADFIMEMEIEDFVEANIAAADLETRIAEAMSK